MKRYVVLAAASIAVCGAALGQTTQNTDDAAFIEGPWSGLSGQYERRPDGGDFARNYPRSARERGMGGTAILCCKPKRDRTLDCRVGAEWPTPEWRFGEASLRIAQKFRLAPGDYDTVMAHPEAELRVPIAFRIEGGSGDRRYEDNLQRAGEVLQRGPICQGERRVTPTS